MNLDSDADTLELSRACTALWTATLSLMAAFMQTSAPAHRYLLARRIAGNLATLREQECFTPSCRQRFGKLARRWDCTAQELRPQPDRPSRGVGLFGTSWFQR